MLTFKTSNRRLEQFLYAHEIYFISCDKTSDNMTVWTYMQTPELDRVVNEWRSIVARHLQKRPQR